VERRASPLDWKPRIMINNNLNSLDSDHIKTDPLKATFQGRKFAKAMDLAFKSPKPQCRKKISGY